MDALANVESGNKNIYSKTDPDVAGPNTRSQGYFQINTPTWRDFRKGTRGESYPNAMSAPRDVQAEVAARIPFSRFGPRTQRMMRSEFGPLDSRQPAGQLGPRDASAANSVKASAAAGAASADAVKTAIAGIADISKESTYSRAGEQLKELRGFVFHHTGGRGDAEGVMRTLNQRGLGVQYVMGRDGKIFRTLPPGSRSAQILPSEHGEGLSNNNVEGMEVIAKNNADILPKQIEAVKNFWRQYHAAHPGVVPYGHGELNPSHKEGDEGKAQVDAIRGMNLDEVKKTANNLRDVIHRPTSQRSQRPPGAGEQDVSLRPGDLLKAARGSGGIDGGGKHTVSGEATLNVNLGKGLVPGGGTKNKGDLFKEIAMQRAATPYANTSA
jgi:hypothetical protein